VQIVGVLLLAVVVWYGFTEREASAISAFDSHAFVMVLGGSTAAILVSSSALTTLRTLLCLREAVPFAGSLGPTTQKMEAERAQLVELWSEGRRAQAVQLGEASRYPAIRQMLELVLRRASSEEAQSAFTELRHDELLRWQPAIGNWELLSRLSPSFGMVGTITGMIQLFKNMAQDNIDIGSALSLALVSTLYGVAFGAGVAGPFGHYLRGMLDERLGVLERCEQSVGDLVMRTVRSAAEGA